MSSRITGTPQTQIMQSIRRWQTFSSRNLPADIFRMASLLWGLFYNDTAALRMHSPLVSIEELYAANLQRAVMFSSNSHYFFANFS